MTDKDLSKFLSLVLRHKPETIGIELDANGWTDVAILLEKMNHKGKQIDMIRLEKIVAESDKQRYAFNADKTQIRANQGHSVTVDLALQAAEPPAILYHGTSRAFEASILQKGLLKGERHHVHLSKDIETARRVGERRDKQCLIFEVDSQKMQAENYMFYVSENGVWLTDHVPALFLRKI